ncbi:unnamed protein product [Diamesa serratosioi]
MVSKKFQFIALLVTILQLLDSATTAPQFNFFGSATTTLAPAAGNPTTTTTTASGGFFGITLPNITMPNITSILDVAVPKPKTFWKKLSDEFGIIFDLVKMEILQLFLTKSLPLPST